MFNHPVEGGQICQSFSRWWWDRAREGFPETDTVEAVRRAIGELDGAACSAPDPVDDEKTAMKRFFFG